LKTGKIPLSCAKGILINLLSDHFALLIYTGFLLTVIDFTVLMVSEQVIRKENYNNTFF